MKVVQAEQFHSEETEQQPEIYVVLSQSALGRLDILLATVSKDPTPLPTVFPREDLWGPCPVAATGINPMSWTDCYSNIQGQPVTTNNKQQQQQQSFIRLQVD